MIAVVVRRGVLCGCVTGCSPARPAKGAKISKNQFFLEEIEK
jgi:hypothetical protein